MDIIQETVGTDDTKQKKSDFQFFYSSPPKKTLYPLSNHTICPNYSISAVNTLSSIRKI